MLKTIKHYTAIEPPPGIYDIQAAFTLSLFWALLGMVPATVFSALTYYNESTIYYGDYSPNRRQPILTVYTLPNGTNITLPPADKSMYAMTPITLEMAGQRWAEPFSGPSNLAYFTWPLVVLWALPAGL